MQPPLNHPQFRRLFCAQVIALLGSGLTTVALTLLAYQISPVGAGSLLGTVLAIKMVAYVFFAPIVGGLAHRFDRKALMVSLDLLRALVVIAMPFVTESWQIYLLIFLLSIFTAGFNPVFQSTIPDLLDNEQTYTRALSLSRLAYDIEALLSPAAAGLVLLVATFDSLFLLNGLAFLLSACLVSLVRLPQQKRVNRLGGLSAQVTFGLRAYWKTPRLRALLALYVGVALASAMVIVNTVVYVRETLGGDESQVVLALAASGMGSMLAALLIPRLLSDGAVRPVLLMGTVLMSPMLLLLSLTPSFSQLLFLWFVTGFGWSLVQTPAGRVVNRSSAPADRDAYYSAQFALTHLCWLVAYPVVGYLGEAVGIELTGLLVGVICAGAALAGYCLWPDPDDRVLLHTHQALTHAHAHQHDDHHQHDHPDAGQYSSESSDHEHQHEAVTHSHIFVIDDHHPSWPR